MSSFPCLVRFVSGSGQVRYRLGERLVDRYLEFVAGRCRPNTLRAVAFDLKTFFTVTGKDPVEVTAADVFDFLADQRGDRTVVRLADRESGLSARTIARRLSSVSGLYAYLVARGDTPVRVNPVPRGLMTRRQGGTMRSRMAPLVRVPRTLPRILSPEEADRLVGGVAHAPGPGDGARACCWPGCAGARCWGCGSRTCRSPTGGWPWWRARAVITGWCRRRTGSSTRSAPTCMTSGPAGQRTDRVFVVLKGPRRGLPLSAEGLDEILDGARRRAGLEHATCHQLRHTCLTRLREAGMALEAVQAQAGHAVDRVHPGLPAPGQRLAG